jgi:hypothetical protein
MGKSFYDLDYIIEINEQRLEQYISAYVEVMSRITTLILVYSVMAIFLVPIVREVFSGGGANWILLLCFMLFMVLFSISIFYYVRLIIPVDLIYLQAPELYYNKYRKQYEQETDDRISMEVFLKGLLHQRTGVYIKV